MWHSIPERFYWNKSNNPRDLAAAHFWYCGALAGSGWVNAQTAEVVRALESLFLREKAKQSISGTLRKRASKLLSACGLDEGEVDATLGLAYEVRSRYVHGDQLTKQDEERIRKQAGDIGVVLRRCLNYLRLALVAAITAGVDKDSLIIAVDAARDGNTRALQRIVDAFRTALPV